MRHPSEADRALEALGADIRACRVCRDLATPSCPTLPHPSWRNSGWLKQNPWFEWELLPVLRQEVGRLT